MWTPTAENLWRDRLAGFGVEVNAGAIIVDGQGYNNVMLSLSSGGGNAVYHERMPVPVSMWQPWRSQTGQTGGAQAHFFDNPIATFAGRRVAPLICYEQLLVWPVLQSLFYAPDVIVATGNDWWTTGTGIIAIQRASTLAWARLFDLPLVMAFNN